MKGCQKLSCGLLDCLAQCCPNMMNLELSNLDCLNEEGNITLIIALYQFIINKTNLNKVLLDLKYTSFRIRAIKKNINFV